MSPHRDQQDAAHAALRRVRREGRWWWLQARHARRVWRWALLTAVAAAALLGMAIVSVPARLEWVELAIGVPAILGLYGWIIWRWGFGPEDRVLFRKKKD